MVSKSLSPGTQEETTRKSLPLLGQQALPVIGAAQVHGEPGILGSFSVWVEGWFYIMFFLILESCKTSTQTPTPFWMTFTSWVNRWIFSILFFFERTTVIFSSSRRWSFLLLWKVRVAIHAATLVERCIKHRLKGLEGELRGIWT